MGDANNSVPSAILDVSIYYTYVQLRCRHYILDAVVLTATESSLAAISYSFRSRRAVLALLAAAAPEQSQRSRAFVPLEK